MPTMPENRKSVFQRMARRISDAVGSPTAFFIAVLLIVLWAASGPIFGFSDTWQLVVNTGTTILTFLTVFLIQNTQNRDTRALQVKLDELIRATKGAHNALLDLEEMEDAELRQFQKRFEELAARAREKGDDGTPKD
jgi:low affinity Fe/Cu permease